MREAIALLVFLGISGLAIVSALRGYASYGLTVILLGFALLSGLGIANYDLLHNAKWEIPGFSLYKNEINDLKKKTIEEITQEAQAQKEIISSLKSDLDKAMEGLSVTIKAVPTLVQTNKRLEESLKKQEEILTEQSYKLIRTAEQIAKLQKSFLDLSQTVIRINWLQLQAIAETNLSRREMALKQATDGLDDMAELAIADPQLRSQFVNEIMNSLPPVQ